MHCVEGEVVALPIVLDFYFKLIFTHLLSGKDVDTVLVRVNPSLELHLFKPLNNLVLGVVVFVVVLFGEGLFASG